MKIISIFISILLLIFIFVVYLVIKYKSLVHYSIFKDELVLKDCSDRKELINIHYNKFEKLSLRAEFFVLFFSVIGFLIDHSKTQGILFVILYSVLGISSISNIFGIWKDRIDNSSEYKNILKEKSVQNLKNDNKKRFSDRFFELSKYKIRKRDLLEYRLELERLNREIEQLNSKIIEISIKKDNEDIQ